MCYLDDYLAIRHNGSKLNIDEVENALKKFTEDTYVSDGVVKWKIDNTIPTVEFLDLWLCDGKEFDYDKSIWMMENHSNQYIPIDMLAEMEIIING